MAETEKKTMTIAEAANYLGISRAHAYVGARKGWLPTLRLGAKWLVPVHALKQMIPDGAQG